MGYPESSLTVSIGMCPGPAIHSFAHRHPPFSIPGLNDRLFGLCEAKIWKVAVYLDNNPTLWHGTSFIYCNIIWRLEGQAILGHSPGIINPWHIFTHNEVFLQLYILLQKLAKSLFHSSRLRPTHLSHHFYPFGSHPIKLKQTFLCAH